MNNRHLFIAAGLTTLGALAGFGVKALADGIPSPNPLYYSGTLTEAGQVVDGTRAITIDLWPDATTAGMPLCQTVASTTQVVGGRFRIALDSSCKAAINQNSGAYVEVIDGATSLGRASMGAVPYAVEADHAVNATNATNATDGGDIASEISALQGSVAALQAVQPPVKAIQAVLTNAINGGTQSTNCPTGYTLVAATLATDQRTASGTEGWTNGGILQCAVSGNTLTASLTFYANGSMNTNIVCYGICVR